MKAPNVTPVLLAVAAALVLTLPAAAGSEASLDPAGEAAPAEVAGEVATDQGPASSEAGAQACIAGAGLANEVLPQSSVEAASTCTAETTCSNGFVLRCSGQTCITEPGCGIWCDGQGWTCGNPCR